MASTAPLSLYESAKKENDITILVFFRGHWCPICIQWLKDWTNIRNFEQQLKDKKGILFVVCSEPQETANEVMEASGLKDVPSVVGIGDPDNTIVNFVNSTGSLDVVITGSPGPFDYRGQVYPKGMVQPAVLITTKEGKVLYAWATIPRMRNLMGALHRPSPVEIWKYITEELTSDTSLKKKPRGKSLRYIFKKKCAPCGEDKRAEKKAAKRRP